MDYGLSTPHEMSVSIGIDVFDIVAAFREYSRNIFRIDTNLQKLSINCMNIDYLIFTFVLNKLFFRVEIVFDMRRLRLT